MTATEPIYVVEQNNIADGSLVWQVIKIGAKRFCYSGPNNKEAVDKGRELAKKNKGALRIYKANGELRSEVSYA